MDIAQSERKQLEKYETIHAKVKQMAELMDEMDAADGFAVLAGLAMWINQNYRDADSAFRIEVLLRHEY